MWSRILPEGAVSGPSDDVLCRKAGFLARLGSGEFLHHVETGIKISGGGGGTILQKGHSPTKSFQRAFLPTNFFQRHWPQGSSAQIFPSVYAPGCLRFAGENILCAGGFRQPFFARPALPSAVIFAMMIKTLLPDKQTINPQFARRNNP